MMTILTVLIVLALIATLVSLGWGIASMAQGGSFDKKHSGQFMNARVILQGVTVVLLIIAFFLAA